ncbi:hypothetical protein [Streptomyces sp. NBC_01304]|uniref:hypothetical protein n=1 Tax=Streptomyces sp. NBC_01304 TaxID=2903818 RepID=UPI002E127BB4|nr:helix-turn-helix domain-containing protein [Streptomyces sp. NBC_01304]
MSDSPTLRTMANALAEVANERARMVAKLADSGYSEAQITAALAVDEATVSRLVEALRARTEDGQ